MLKIENVIKYFDKDTPNERIALKNISLEINEGDFVTVIGGNGAGKSTLMGVISGAVTPDSGKIFIDDVDVTQIKEHNRAKWLGRVFQDPSKGTAPDMEILENLAMANRRGSKRTLRWWITPEEQKNYEQKLINLDLGLDKRLHAKVGLLSGGQRQALTLLMATLQKPKLLLLDEHTAALDPKTAFKVMQLTDKVVNENKLTTLMITHNMRDAIKYGNRLIMLSNGEIIYDVGGEEKSKLTVDDLLNRFEISENSME